MKFLKEEMTDKEYEEVMRRIGMQGLLFWNKTTLQDKINFVKKVLSELRFYCECCGKRLESKTANQIYCPACALHHRIQNQKYNNMKYKVIELQKRLGMVVYKEEQ